MKYLIGVVLMVAVVGCTDTTWPDVQQQPSTTVLQPSTTVLAAITNLSFAQISAGTEYSCGRMMTGGKLYCWGENSYGQLGFC
jgi:alpha-tubulin suppressor-like RCC1 family protein